MREAVILAGGMASRLGDAASQTPKAMLQVAGRPFIDHVAWNLKRYGVGRIVVAAGRLGDQLVAHVGDGSVWGVDAEVVVEPEPLGTGGAAALAANRLAGEEFLLLNGDTLLDVDYLDLLITRREAGASLAMALREVDDTARYGSVGFDGTRVTSFAEKGPTGPGFINGGVYALERSVFADSPSTAFSLEHDLLGGLVDSGRVAGVATSGLFVDIGVPESLALASQQVASWRDKPLVLLDRDGVLNVDRGWVHTAQEWEWIPGAIDAVKYLNDCGALVAVVTNQAGIARGMYTEDEYLAFERWIAEHLAVHGAHLDAVYHCPHHPTQGATELTRVCDCRKPAPGMLRTALAEFGVEAGRALFIGDKESDMAAGSAAGVRTARYAGGNVLDFVEQVVPCV
jgi:D-glycero-D-manno-heptose 1,7-bisphosphate phosphatase